MKVYLVSCFFHNEGSSNLAVYDAKIKAETYGQKVYDDYVRQGCEVSCSMKIEEFEVL